MITVILEEDLVKYLSEKKITFKEPIKMCLNKLVNDIRKVIATFRDKLPGKAKRYNWLHVLWLIPLLHNGFKDFELRDEVGTILEDIVATQNGMSALRLKQVWDETKEQHNFGRQRTEQ